jgi:hypothetical protein
MDHRSQYKAELENLVVVEHFKTLPTQQQFPPTEPPPASTHTGQFHVAPAQSEPLQSSFSWGAL